jgi:hypothetical protein
MTFSISKIKNVLFLGIFLSGVVAMADESRSGLFVEPSLSYETGDTSTNYPAPLSNASGKSDGFGLGVRIGFHFAESLFLGLDGRYAMPQFKDSSVSYDAKSVATNWGPVLGIQMPNIGLRIWGTVILGGDLNPEESSRFDVVFKNAKGYRVGAGFRLAAVSLNLEYQQLKYGETTLEQIGPFSAMSALTDVTLESKSWIASVSFPLEL